MIGRDLADDLHRAVQNFGLDTIAKILSTVNNRTIPEVKNIALKRWIVYAPLIKRLDQTIRVGGVDIELNQTKGVFTTNAYFRYIPNNPHLYQLTHTLTGTPTFPNDNVKQISGVVSLDGTQYITTTHHTDLNMGSGSFGFAFWIKKTSTGTYGIICKRDIQNTTNAGIEYWINGTTINIRISDGSNTALLSVTFANLNDGNWHSVIANIPNSGNLEIFVDKVSQGTQARGSVGSVNNTRNCYEWARDNNGVLQDKFNGKLKWFVWKAEIWTSQQITDFHDNGILKLNSSNTVDVIVRPLIAEVTAKPNCTIGEFRWTT
ncbi:MAG: hypothetical protein HZC29_02140 [Thaumarchaeota archaeon]|nr:hypothetical protein [Nitrososphaerota archaeon]